MIKRGLIISLMIILSLQVISAGSVGISPAKIKEFFEPNLIRNYDFRAYNEDSDAWLKVSLLGDISKYANISKEFVKDGETFTVSIRLPKELETPGTNRLFVEIIEYKNESGNEKMIGGVAAIRAPIDIIVPYPGIYIEPIFSISDINEGENTDAEIRIRNLGTQDISIKPRIEIRKNNKNGDLVVMKEFTERAIETKRELKITEKLNTSILPPGIYFAEAIIDYEGQSKKINQTLRVGEFLVEIIDYSYKFEKGKISPFTVQVENKWNSEIGEIYAEVEIIEDQRIVESFKTISTDAGPWEKKNITGYFETANLSVGRHITNIILYFEDKTTNKVVAIYIEEPLKENNYTIYIVAGSITLGIIVLLTIIYLLIKVNKLKEALKKRKNEKEKRKEK